LATVKPYEDDERGMTASEFGAYCRGYYSALGAALRAMDLALRTRALWLRGRRRAARLAAIARAAAVVDDARVGEREQLGIDGDPREERQCDRRGRDREALRGVIAARWISDAERSRRTTSDLDVELISS
jgi:hypothetical protein